jgi:RHS repeat-associated protein
MGTLALLGSAGVAAGTCRPGSPAPGGRPGDGRVPSVEFPVSNAPSEAGLPGLGVQTPAQLAKWRAGLAVPAASRRAGPAVPAIPRGAGDRATPAPTVFFTGKPYDADLGAYLFNYRSYDPALCRWTTQDPSGFPDGANNWVYVNNGATNGLDPWGLVRFEIYDLNGSPEVQVHHENNLQLAYRDNVHMGAFVRQSKLERDHSGGEWIVKFGVGIYVNCDLKRESAIESGHITTYIPHVATLQDAQIGGGFQEACVRHEKGHASAFFSTQYAAICGHLNFGNFDNFDYNTAVTEINNAINLEHNPAYSNGHYGLEMANQFTRQYFAGLPNWKKIGEDKWQKE